MLGELGSFVFRDASQRVDTIGDSWDLSVGIRSLAAYHHDKQHDRGYDRGANQPENSKPVDGTLLKRGDPVEIVDSRVIVGRRCWRVEIIWRWIGKWRWV